MKKVLFTMAGAVALLLSLSAVGLAQDVNGSWDLTIVSPQGEGKTKADLKQAGEDVTGTLQWRTGPLPITGKVKGNDVKLMFTIKFQDNDLPITLSGKLNGGSIKGDADFGGLAQGDWSATKGAGGSAPAASTSSAAASSSASAAGDWTVTFNTPNGDVQAKMSLKQDGDAVSGTASAPDGATVPIKGTVKGGDLELKYTIKYDGNDLPITMKGKLAAGEMKGNADYGGLAEGEFKGKKSN